MRDRKLVGSRQRSLSRRSRHARPLLAGNNSAHLMLGKVHIRRKDLGTRLGAAGQMCGSFTVDRYGVTLCNHLRLENLPQISMEYSFRDS